jgi:uncharacterized protein (DUF983 family)
MTPTASETIPTARETGPALRNGLRQRCPKCGEGKLFARYLKVNDTCPACGEALHHHRADDVPAYLTILIVAHIVGVSLPLAFGHLDPLALAVALCAAATVMMLLMLPRMKGLTVAYQWATRMHGFDAATP